MNSYIRLAQLVVAAGGLVVASYSYSNDDYQAAIYWLVITVIAFAALRLVPPIIFPSLSVQHNVAKMKHDLEGATITVYPLTHGRYRYYRDKYSQASKNEPFTVSVEIDNKIILTRLPDKKTVSASQRV